MRREGLRIGGSECPVFDARCRVMDVQCPMSGVCLSEAGCLPERSRRLFKRNEIIVLVPSDFHISGARTDSYCGEKHNMSLLAKSKIALLVSSLGEIRRFLKMNVKC